MRLLSFVFLWLLIFIMPWEGLFAIPGLTSAARILGLLTFLLGLAGGSSFPANCDSHSRLSGLRFSRAGAWLRSSGRPIPKQQFKGLAPTYYS